MYIIILEEFAGCKLLPRPDHDPDCCQNQSTCPFYHSGPLHKLSSQYAMLPTDRQTTETDKQTNQSYGKHNLVGGDDNKHVALRHSVYLHQYSFNIASNTLFSINKDRHVQSVRGLTGNRNWTDDSYSFQIFTVILWLMHDRNHPALPHS